MKAIWNDVVIAESDKTINIEGNHYFPPKSINEKFFRNSKFHTICIWKGKASYYDIIVDGKTNKDAAWYYPKPSFLAKRIKGYIAFWQGVEVVNDRHHKI